MAPELLFLRSILIKLNNSLKTPFLKKQSRDQKQNKFVEYSMEIHLLIKGACFMRQKIKVLHYAPLTPEYNLKYYIKRHIY